MKFSSFFSPTLKNIPAEAEIISHQLMIRAGMIKQASAGIYSWLPLGLKVLKKIEHIVRDEQNKAGAIELLMPTIQSADLWIKSGRYEDYGKEMLRIRDRSGREMLYGPTNEELITDIFQSYITSYKDLPKNLYHIQWKFRDEVRPRFGVMRGREFLMKDNYSFDLTEEESKISYNKMFTAYIKTFLRMGLTPISLRAETGPIGGNLSHEFQILAKTGESTLYYDKDLEKIDPETINPDKLQSYYAAVDGLHDEKNCPISKEQLKISKGIEVGHIFYFGDKYSKPMNASVDYQGKKEFVKMGSYGVGVSRLVGAIIEAKYDDKNETMNWPIAVSPYDCAIIPLINKKDSSNLEKAYNIFKYLSERKLETIIDDTDENFSSKIKKFNLIGIPFQIMIGKKTEGDLFEFKEIGKDSKNLSIENIAKIIINRKK